MAQKKRCYGGNSSESWPSHPSLTRSEVRKASKALRAAGQKLPKVGYCLRSLPPGAVRGTRVGNYTAKGLCHDARGYYALY